MELDPWEQEAPIATGELDPWEQPSAAAPAPKEIVNLPKPSPNMFANMNDEEAKILHDAYTRHPNTQTAEDGTLIHNGVPVPATEGNTPFVDAAITGMGAVLDPGGTLVRGAREFFGGEEDILAPSEAVAGGVINAARELPTLGAAAGESIGVLPEGSFEAVDDALPAYNPEGAWEGGLSTVGQIGAGVFIGAKGMGALTQLGGAKKAADIATKLPKAIQYIAKTAGRAAGGAAGSAATLPGDTDTMLVGPDAYLTVFKGMDGMNESEAQAELEKRMNIFSDAMILAAPAEVLADMGKGLGNILYEGWLKPLVGVGSENVQQKLVMQSIYDKLAQATGAETPAEIEEIKQVITNMLKDPGNRKLVFNLGKEGMENIDTQLDTVSVIERGLAKDPSERAQAVVENLKRQRKGVIENVGERTEIAMNRPTSDLQKMTEQGEAAFGGDEGIEASSRGVQRAGQERVGGVIAEGENIGVQKEMAEQALPDQIASEGQFGGKLAQTADESGSATRLDRNAIAADLRERVETGTNVLRDQKNQLYNDIKSRPVAVPDDEAMTQALDNVGFQRANDVDELGQAILPDENVVSILPQNISDAIEASREDLSTLYTDVAPMLRQHMSDVLGDSKFKTPEYLKLEGLYKEITENQLNTLRQTAEESGDLELLDIVNDFDSARAYYQDVYKPVAQSGVIKDIGEIKGKFRNDLPTQKDEIGSAIQKTITSDQPDRVKHFVETIGRPEYGGDRTPVLQYVLADLSDNLRTKIKASGLGELDISDALGTLKNYRQTLKEFPELTKELDTFENNLIANKSNIKQLEKGLKVQAGNLEEVQEEVYKDVFDNFFNANGSLKPSGAKSFSDLFSNQQNTAKLDQVMKVARESGDPMVEDGIKAAYFKHLQKTLFAKETGAGGAKSLASAKASDVVNNAEGTLEMGNKIFGEGSPMMKAVVGLVDPSLESALTKKMSGIKMGKTGFSQQEATAARNQMVMFFVGPLTRVGARIGAVSGRALEYLSPDKAARRIADTLFSNPDEFLRVSEAVMGKKVSGTAMRDAFNFLVKTGIYQEEDWDKYRKDVEDQQTREAIPN